MIRLIAPICTVLLALLFASSSSIRAAEIARYDDGPFAGMGFPYSESARVEMECIAGYPE